MGVPYVIFEYFEHNLCIEDVWICAYERLNEHSEGLLLELEVPNVYAFLQYLQIRFIH